MTVTLGGAPLEVRIDGALPLSGTGPASLLSLAAGNYDGVLEVHDGGHIRIASARATASRCDRASARHGPSPLGRGRGPRGAGRPEPDSVRSSRATLSGWVLTRLLRDVRSPPTERIPRRRAFRCGCAEGETEHALIARGAPATLPGTERVWTHAESDDSMLVRVHGDEAEILGTSSVRGRNIVRGCPTRVVLGVVPTAFLTRDVVSALGLRMRPVGRGYVLERHPRAALLRDDLLVADVVVAADGVPFDRWVRSHSLARDLARVGNEIGITVLRDGESVELAARFPRDEHRGERRDRDRSELERSRSSRALLPRDGSVESLLTGSRRARTRRGTKRSMPCFVTRDRVTRSRQVSWLVASDQRRVSGAR